jgi:putative ABC transport system permease protein
MEAVKGLAGVQSVGANTCLPLEGSSAAVSEVAIEGRLEKIPSVSYAAVSPDYFRTLGIPLVQGRYFADADGEGSPTVAIVSQSFARRYFPSQNCLGKRVENWLHENEWTTIVGVVGDVREELESEVSPEVYLSYLQAGEPHMTLVVRTAGDPMGWAAAVRTQIASLDQDQPPHDLVTLEELKARSLAPRRVNMLLLGAFAALGLVLGSMGIYGVVSYSVSQRTHEIGIRMAMGAGQRGVLYLIVGRGLLLVVAGEALGLAGALTLNRVISSMVFRVATTDLFTYAGVALVWTAVALLAYYVPARRATKLDPVVALRYE